MSYKPVELEHKTGKNPKFPTLATLKINNHTATVSAKLIKAGSLS